MKPEDFEKQLIGEKRILPCRSMQIYGTVPFMAPVLPENMVWYANKADNQKYSLLKINSGVGKFDYYVGHSTGGLIYTTCETPQARTGGIPMGWIEDATAWFAEHETTRKFVKGFIVFGVGFLAANQAALMAELPVWAIVPIGALVTALVNYVQTHTVLPIVGAKK